MGTHTHTLGVTSIIQWISITFPKGQRLARPFSDLCKLGFKPDGEGVKQRLSCLCRLKWKHSFEQEWARCQTHDSNVIQVCHPLPVCLAARPTANWGNYPFRGLARHLRMPPPPSSIRLCWSQNMDLGCSGQSFFSCPFMEKLSKAPEKCRQIHLNTSCAGA